jgi:hypothetical protein
MGYRGINYLIVGIVELFVIFMLMRSRGISKQIAKLRGKEESK